MRILITGASGALGSATVQAASRLGHQVVIIERSVSAGQPENVRSVACQDLGDPAAASAAIEEAGALHGGIDALVHLVGSFDWIPVEQSTLAQWRHLYATNVETTLNVVQAALPLLARGASIVCVGAASAQVAGAGMAPYAAAKSGVAKLVEALAAELKTRGIRVNAVLPSVIDTPRNRADMPEANPADWTTPDAIADTLMFLSSPGARAINGALIPVTNNA
jgi:NAD(P)-dependent dehydrogenase (short-subunit alcohol dehydrogenase family)